MPAPPARPEGLSAATTRTRTVRRPPGTAAFLLEPPEVVVSPPTRLRYRIERLLGAGGFGQVYLARRLGFATSVPETVCIKASARIDGWLREAYFGQLLDGHPRAIRVFDTFPLLRPEGHVLYCLALEYAQQGDLRTFLHRTGKGWPETTTRREIAGILQVLGKLHRGQMLHRDLTPLNVFVCEGRTLKIGDFGIVRQQSDDRGITARHHEHADRPERDPGRRRAEVAGPRRRLPGRPAARDAGEGRRAGAPAHLRDPRAAPAATT